MNPPLADIARGKWRSVLPQLGLPAERLDGKHGPCPMCGGKDRFRFTDYQQGGGFICNACGNGDGIDFLRRLHGWTFPQCDEAVRPLVGGIEADPRPREKRSGGTAHNRRLWDAGRTIALDNEAGCYLASRRLPVPKSVDLRFVADCRVTGVEARTSLPAMIALVRDPAGTAVSLHRTYLLNGAKAPIESPRRMMPGPLPLGSAIRLAGHRGRLAVAEGIETAIAVMRDFRTPCWAASNATMLAELVWGDDVEELHIFGDHDKKFGGQAAAYRLAFRAATHKRAPAVQVHIPPVAGEDWLDHGNAILEGRRAAQ